MSSPEPSRGHRLRIMSGRDPDELHRVATPLELLYDLTFAVAFAVAGEQFAHLLAEGHFAAGSIGFVIAVFAVCWCWINYSWFASAYDTDDWAFRVATMVQMVGVIILSLGLPQVFHSIDEGRPVDNSVTVAGVMRGTAIAGPAAFIGQIAYANPFWEAIVDFDGLVDCVTLSGSPDDLKGEDGNDVLIGDNQITIAGVVDGDLLVAGAGTGAQAAKKLYDSALVEFDQLVGSVSTCGSMDWLDGGADHDLLIGDQRLLVVGVQMGAVARGDATFVSDLANAHGRLSTEALVDFDQLVGCISLSADQDTLTGGDGNDEVIGDNQVAVVAAVVGPLLVADSADPTAVASTIKPVAQSEAMVEFDQLIGTLNVNAARDTLVGDAGNDRLVGDNSVMVAGTISGAVTAGFAVAAGSTTPTLPTEIDVIRFHPLVGCLSIDADRDALNGSAGDDDLIGDNAVQVLAAVGAGTGGNALTKYKLVAEFDGLINDLTISAANDTVLGGDGNDCLIGDSELTVAGVIDGAQSSDGLRVEIEKLGGSIKVKGADDRLEGGTGDDHLVGDSNIALTGLIVTAGGMLGNRSIETDNLLCSLRVEGGGDTLLGGDGNDVLIGDAAASFVGVQLPAVQQPSGGGGGDGGPILVFAATATTVPLLQVDGLVGSVDLVGGRDTLDGGANNDVLYGDHHLTVAGVIGSVALNQSLRVEIEDGLLGCVNVSNSSDKLSGGTGDDQLFGDSRVELAAMAGAASAGSNLELEVGGLIGNLGIDSSGDQLYGNDGNDRLVGDNQLLVAGLVLTGGAGGNLTLDVDGLVCSLRLWTNCSSDSLDGGNGDDTLVGDQSLSLAAVLDATAGAGGAAGGSVVVDIHELVSCMCTEAGNDSLIGGAGADLLIGDSQTVVTAFLGGFATPIAAGIQVKGDRLVNTFDMDAANDTLRGGDGNDQLVGDSDATVALLSGSVAGPTGSYGMTRLMEKLTIAAGNDDIKGDGGTNVVEQGNRAIAPKELVKTVSISALSKTNSPAAVPVIDWQGQVCDTATGSAGWVDDFVNSLGQSGDDRNPNSKIRIRL